MDNEEDMDIDVGENEEYQEDKPHPATMKCLGIRLILGAIFKHLSTSQLLQLSVVNPQWRDEARSVMKERGNVIAQLYIQDCACKKLRRFATDLKQMRIVPFVGLSISIEPEWSCTQCPSLELDPVYNNILDRMEVKYLSLVFGENWAKHKDSQAFLFIKKLLEELGSVIQEFTLWIEVERESFIQMFLQNCSFSGLQKLTLEDTEGTTGDDYTRLIKALVSRAPHLQTLHTDGRVDLASNLLEGSSAVYVSKHPYTPSSAMELPEGAASALRIKEMQLTHIKPNFNLGRFNTITEIVLRNSCEALTSMEIYAIFLVPLKIYGIRLEHVESLRILLNPSEVEMMQPFVTAFNFTRILPKVKGVTVRLTFGFNTSVSREFLDMVDRRNVNVEEREEPVRGRAVKIWSLTVECSSWALEDSSVGFLWQLFPDVRQLEVRDATEVGFATMWKSWLGLRYLYVTLVASWSQNVAIASVVAQIFPQEVAELAKMRDRRLRGVTIIPTTPSIHYLKGLRHLDLCYTGTLVRSPEARDDLVDLFSKVTGLSRRFRKKSEDRDPLEVTLGIVTDGRYRRSVFIHP